MNIDQKECLDLVQPMDGLQSAQRLVQTSLKQATRFWWKKKEFAGEDTKTWSTICRNLLNCKDWRTEPTNTRKRFKVLGIQANRDKLLFA